MTVENQYAFTVFTPTYNRAKTIHRVYESLCAQTFRDFEWLIVDDGSTDNTRELITRWQVDATFPIRYIYQQNQHKKVAHNCAIQAARGELFLSLDSDDACKPNALECLWWHWQAIPALERQQYSAVTALCEDETGKLVGSHFPTEAGKAWLDSDSVELSFRYRVKGEKWGFQRTDVLREYPFPCDGIQGLVPENIVWEAIATHYKTRFVNESLRIYHAGSDQITRTVRPDQHALGHALAFKSSLEHGARYFFYSPIVLLDLAMSFVRFNAHVQQQKLTPIQVQGWLPNALLMLMKPVGYLRFLLDCHRLKGH